MKKTTLVTTCILCIIGIGASFITSDTLSGAEDTPSMKIERYYKLQEMLRVEFNAMGEKYRNGQISEREWITFKEENRAKAQALAEKYTSIRDAEWFRQYGVIDPKNATTSAEIDRKKKEYKDSKKWSTEELQQELYAL